MKVAVTMLSFSDYIKNGQMTVQEFINLMAGYKVDAVDLLDYYWQDREKEIRAVPGWLKDAGLELGAFCTGNNFVLPPEERVKQIEKVKEAIDTAARLGAGKLRVFGGHWVDAEGAWKVPENINRPEWLKVIVECLNKCVEYARDNNVILALENHNHIPITIEETRYVIEEVNSPYLRLNFDIGNFRVSAGEDSVKAAEELHKYVVHVHAKDAVPSTEPGRKHEFCPLGMGFVQVNGALDVLKQKGYDGCVSIEYEGWKHLESKFGVKKSVEYLRSII